MSQAKSLTELKNIGKKIAERLIAVGYGEEQLKNAVMPDADENRRVTVINVNM